MASISRYRAGFIVGDTMDITLDPELIEPEPDEPEEP